MDRDAAVIIVAGILALAVWINSRPVSRVARASGIKGASRAIDRAGCMGSVLMIVLGVLALWVMGGG